MTAATVYNRIYGLAMVGFFAALSVMFAAVVKLSIPLGLLALMITVLSGALAVPSLFAARQIEGEHEVDTLPLPPNQPRA